MDQTNPSVVIAFCHSGHPTGNFLDSFAKTVMIESMREDGLIRPPGGYIMLRSSPRIAEARSQLVETFLNSPTFKGADWLFMVDADMTWEPDAVRRLVEAADPDKRPIMGGLCFGGSSPENQFPTIGALIPHDEAGWELKWETNYPADSVIRVGATGAACLLIHRTVLLAMYHHFKTLPNGKPNPYPWFVEGHTDHHGRSIGEDVAFCIRAQAIGAPIHVHTGVQFGHEKSIVLSEDTWPKMRKKKDR